MPLPSLVAVSVLLYRCNNITNCCPVRRRAPAAAAAPLMPRRSHLSLPCEDVKNEPVCPTHAGVSGAKVSSGEIDSEKKGSTKGIITIVLRDTTIKTAFSSRREGKAGSYDYCRDNDDGARDDDKAADTTKRGEGDGGRVRYRTT